jgi:ThiF family
VDIQTIMLVRLAPLVLPVVVVAMVGITTTTGLVSLVKSRAASVSPFVHFERQTARIERVRSNSNVKFGPTGRTKWTMTAQAASTTNSDTNGEYSRPQSVAATTVSTTSTPKSTSTSTTCLSHEEIARYSRHLVLDAVGVRGQEALRNASVLVIGAGGLGSPALLYLAAAGIGRIGIVDGDTVDTSNLQRQIIHSMSSVGMTKCESAQQRIAQLNPHVKVRRYEYEFTASTAHDILGRGFDDEHAWNVVVDGSDNFPTKYLIK